MSRLHITDHGLSRYLERVRGVDLEAVRAEIRARLAPGLAKAERIAGGRAYGVRTASALYVIDDGRLVTVTAATAAFRPAALDEGRR